VGWIVMAAPRPLYPWEIRHGTHFAGLTVKVACQTLRIAVFSK